MPSVVYFNYFAFAAAADAASLGIRQAIEATITAVDRRTSGMAGNDDLGKSWGDAYNDAVNQVVPNVCRLADAYGAIANRAYKAGVNHMNAEWVAGGMEGPPPTPPTAPPANTAQRPVFGYMPDAIGSHGEGLITDIPGLLEEIGSVPNGDDDALVAASAVFDTLTTKVDEHAAAVDRIANQPLPPDAGNDAVLLLEEYSTSMKPAASSLSRDVTSLAAATLSFGNGIRDQRNQMYSEISWLGVGIGLTIAIGAAGTVVTATGSDLAAAGVTTLQVANTATRIRRLIAVLEDVMGGARTTLTTIETTSSAIRALIHSIEKPVANFVQDDHGVIQSQEVFPTQKQAAWERYLARCGNKCKSLEEWSRLYDQLMINVAQGGDWDQAMKELFGYEGEGWESQFTIEEFGRDRIWDWANPDPEVMLLIENKSGRLDRDQLVYDELALQDDWNIQYNIRAPIAPADYAKLLELQAKYPGQVSYWIGDVPSK